MTSTGRRAIELQRATGMFHGFFGQGDLLPAAAAPTQRALASLRSALAPTSPRDVPLC